jgi:hypothetical protein
MAFAFELMYQLRHIAGHLIGQPFLDLAQRKPFLNQQDLERVINAVKTAPGVQHQPWCLGAL